MQTHLCRHFTYIDVELQTGSCPSFLLSAFPLFNVCRSLVLQSWLPLCRNFVHAAEIEAMPFSGRRQPLTSANAPGRAETQVHRGLRAWPPAGAQHLSCLPTSSNHQKHQKPCWKSWESSEGGKAPVFPRWAVVRFTPHHVRYGRARPSALQGQACKPAGLRPGRFVVVFFTSDCVSSLRLLQAYFGEGDKKGGFFCLLPQPQCSVRAVLLSFLPGSFIVLAPSVPAISAPVLCKYSFGKERGGTERTIQIDKLRPKYIHAPKRHYDAVHFFRAHGRPGRPRRARPGIGS